MGLRTRMKVTIYKDRRGEWRWTLYARNGRKVACSGEGYTKRATCARMSRRLFGSIYLVMAAVKRYWPTPTAKLPKSNAGRARRQRG